MFRVFRIVVTSLFIVGIIYYSWPAFFGPSAEETKQRASARIFMENEMNSLKPVEGAVYKRPEVSSANKYPHLWVRSQFDSKQDLTKVINHYDSQLRSQGWMRATRSGLWGSAQVIFLKGEYEIAIDKTSPDVNPNTYKLEISLENNKIRNFNMFMLIFLVCGFCGMLYAIVRIIYGVIKGQSESVNETKKGNGWGAKRLVAILLLFVCAIYIWLAIFLHKPSDIIILMFGVLPFCYGMWKPEWLKGSERSERDKQINAWVAIGIGIIVIIGSFFMLLHSAS